MRTTIDIDTSILRDLKKLQKQERTSLGRLVSDLLAQALERHDRQRVRKPVFEWVSRGMHARVDLADKDAVQAILDRS